MSAAVNSKRLWVVPERPLSADPTPPSSSRPFSSFSSSISAMFSGRHSRSNSTSRSGQNVTPARSASAAPQQAKWVPRHVTPGSANQPRPSRHRSTSSASAAAAALATSIDAPLPPLPVVGSQHRSNPTLPDEDNAPAVDAWKVNVQRRLFMKYRNRLLALERTFANGGSNTKSHRRDSLSSGSSASIGSNDSDTQSWEEIPPHTSRDETMMKLKDEYEKEMRSEIRREASRLGVSPDLMPPAPSLFAVVPHRSQRSREYMHDILVEDEPADEWTWRPDANGRRHSDDARQEKWRERVRQDQQVILESIKLGHAPASEQQQQQQSSLSTSANRKVHFASPSADPAASRNPTPPSATPLSATQTQLPFLPRTPHTAGAPVHPARSISAHPSVSSSNVTRPISPAVAAPGVRPGSVGPSSTAYARWLPPASQISTSSLHVTGHGHRTGSNPIAIPRRNSGTAGLEGNGSAGGDKTTGSWRDWTSSTHGLGYLQGSRREAPKPSPTAGNGILYAYAYTQQHLQTASNGCLHSSAPTYAGAQMHHRTPSSGNLQTSHNRAPSGGNVNGGINRRAATPGPMSSASAYARQRTASATQRVPSVPPIVSNPTRDKVHDRESAYGKEYVSGQDKARPKNAVIDDRDPDGERAGSNPVRRVQATAGLGSRTSSSRSALVDEDAPAPEAFTSSPAPVVRASSSRQRHSTSSSPDEEEEVQIPKRDKGKGKARAQTSPVFSPKSLPRTGRDVIAGLYVAQLEDYAILLRRDLGISTEA